MRGSFAELMVVAIVAALMVLFFGAKKLPELAKSFSESRKIMKSDVKEAENAENIEQMRDDSTTEPEVVETVVAREIEETKADV